MKKIFVLNNEGKPLMPTDKAGKVRRLLKTGQAEIFQHEPFTIKLLYNTPDFIQPITLGVDLGYSFVGISAITKKEELYGGELQLRNDISGLMEERNKYRRARRNRLRYREKRFDNRKRPDGWLPPSTQNKLDNNIKFIEQQINILPVKNINIETAIFDIQKIQNEDIAGVEYQQGPLFGYQNVKLAVKHRDNHKCQNPNCKHKDDKNVKLHVHHIIYKRLGGSDKLDNLITLCVHCHNDKNHSEKGFLYQWMLEGKKTIKSFKSSTFMNIIRKRTMEYMRNTYPDINISETCGYITQSKRYIHNIEKSHHNDAFVIAGGNNPNIISKTIKSKSERRNNRSLQSFTDAKYIDSRTGKQDTGRNLGDYRKSKEKKESEKVNNRIYRKTIVDENNIPIKKYKGKFSIRKQKYDFSKGSLVKINQNWKSSKLTVSKNDTFISGGTQNIGAYIIHPNGLVPSKICTQLANRKGIIEIK